MAGQALLVGVASLLWPLPPLLKRCGLEVDVVSARSPYFVLPGRHRTAIRARTLSEALVSAARISTQHRYDLIVVADDTALQLLARGGGLSPADRLRLAPVMGAENLGHLGSKFEVNRLLDDAAIPVPRWTIAQTPEQVLPLAREVGWPLVLKNDTGSAGRGVRVVRERAALPNAWRELAAARAGTGVSEPAGAAGVLVQQFLPGPDIDLSAFFGAGRLVHFTYSEVLAEVYPGGPAATRRYRPTSLFPQVRDELAAIGAALGLDGFVSISARADGDAGARRYIEVDSRPTLWAHVGAGVGDDPAARLRRWFAEGTVDLSATAASPRPVQVVRMAQRTRRRDLLRNADGVWRDVPWGSADAWLVSASAVLRGPGAARGWRGRAFRGPTGDPRRADPGRRLPLAGAR